MITAVIIYPIVYLFLLVLPYKTKIIMTEFQ